MTKQAADLFESGDATGATQICHAILNESPDHLGALNLLGMCQYRAGRYQEALALLRRSAQSHPQSAPVQLNLGAVLIEQNLLEEALVHFEAAIRLQPNYAEAYYDRGMVRLLRGDLAGGWWDYEWRKKKAKRLGSRQYPAPLWTGIEALVDKTILVHFEQGLGDTIQFCRYIPMLEPLGARVLFAPQPELRALMRSLDGSFELVAADRPGQRYDYHCPLLSLPLAFATRLDTIPAAGPYLSVDPARAAAWRERIGGHGFRIGIAWQGKREPVDIGRSCPLVEFRGLSQIPGVRLISLHTGSDAEQRHSLPAEMIVESPGDDFDTGPDAFLDAAAVMQSCDLVITIDTAIAHLAGALGIRTWVALKHVPDWRWLLERSDSPWYPTMRLFRQGAGRDWSGVFQDMERALRSELRSISEG